jgi:hypothetical protein
VRLVLAQVFAGVGAALLVTAFALASLLRPSTTLAAAIAQLDHAVLLAWQQAERTGVAAWVAGHVVVPMLVRPVWLGPVAVGVVFLGVALSLGITRQGGDDA